MATHSEIQALFHCKKFNRFISKMQPEHLREDLKSEVLLVLMEQPPGRVELLAKREKLLPFAIRTAMNMVTQKGNRFGKMYKTADTDDVPELPAPELNGRVAREEKEEPLYALLLRIRGLAYKSHTAYLPELLPDIGWYQQHMLSIYMKLGSYREIEKETGIPWESCYLTIRNTMQTLRKKFNTVAA